MKWILQASRLAVILNVAPNWYNDFRNMSESIRIANGPYLLLEPMIVESGFKLDESQKVAHGREHTFADMVSIVF